MSINKPTTIEQYADFAQEIISNNPQMNESNTKHKLINPLIEVLGWDHLTDVELEYAVQMGANSKNVDYSISYEGAPVIFVEVKGNDSKIRDKDRKQLRSYLLQQNVDWGLLTNGENFEIIRREVDGGDIDIEVIDKISIGEISREQNLLKALSKDYIRNGESQKIASEIKRLRRAKRKLQENKEQLAEDITHLITDSVGESVSQKAENHAKELIDRMVDNIASDTSTSKHEKEKRQSQDKQTQNAQSIDDYTGTKPKQIHFNGETLSVKSWKEMLAGVSEEIYKSEEEFTQALEIQGRTRNYFTRDAEELRRPKSIGDSGYYFEGCLNANQMVRICYRLLDQFGYSEDDLEIYLDRDMS